MKTSESPRSGKLGDRVAYKSRFGQVERQYVQPRANPTAAKLLANAIFGRITKIWGDLPDDYAQLCS